MKIAPTTGDDVESTLCDVDRMAEVLQDILESLGEHNVAREVPEKFMAEVELAVMIGSHLKEMIAALKVEFYADFEKRSAAERLRKAA